MPTPDEYAAHLAADDARLAEMDAAGIDPASPDYFEAWCDRMSYAHNCAPEPETEAEI